MPFYSTTVYCIVHTYCFLFCIVSLFFCTLLCMFALCLFVCLFVCLFSLYLLEDLLEDRPLQAEGAFLTNNFWFWSKPFWRNSVKWGNTMQHQQAHCCSYCVCEIFHIQIWEWGKKFGGGTTIKDTWREGLGFSIHIHCISWIGVGQKQCVGGAIDNSLCGEANSIVSVPLG